MKIYPLKAAHGDALIIQFSSKNGDYTIVIDGGPSETAEYVVNLYDKLGYIDLLVLTHYDEDHIAGLLDFFSCHKKDKVEYIGQVWVNGAHLIYYDDDMNASAYENAFNLTSCLNHLKSNGFIGNWMDGITNDITPIITDDYRIDILSPTSDILQKLEREFKQYVDAHGLQDDSDVDEEVSSVSVSVNAGKSLEELSGKTFKKDYSFMNRTSIAFLLRAEGKNILLMGDADPMVVVDALNNLILKDESLSIPLRVDLMKVSHHGSKYNTCRTLLDMLDCPNYLFTTNGGTGSAYHPDRMTLAYIKKYARCAEEQKLNFYFNYPLFTIEERNTGLLTDAERTLFNIIDQYDNNTVPLIIL